jgi:ankyrin repeat protein
MARLLLSLGAVCSLVACHARAVTPLSAAARAGDLAMLRGLLDAGADPNDVGEDDARWPPLLHAVHARQLDAARLLLARGADPNRSARGYTALMMAAAEPDAVLLNLLLDHGADPYAQGPGGMTALTVGVSGGALTDLHRPLAGRCSPGTVSSLLARAADLRLPSTAAGREARFWAALHLRIQQTRNIVGVIASAAPPITTCDAPFAAAETPAARRR